MLSPIPLHPRLQPVLAVPWPEPTQAPTLQHPPHQPIRHPLPHNTPSTSHRLAAILYLYLLEAGRVEPPSSRESHGDVSWVVSTPRSPIPALLHSLALQLKPCLSGSRAPEHPLFTPSLLVLIQVARRGRKG